MKSLTLPRSGPLALASTPRDSTGSECLASELAAVPDLQLPSVGPLCDVAGEGGRLPTEPVNDMSTPKEEGGSTCRCGSMVAIALATPGSKFQGRGRTQVGTCTQPAAGRAGMSLQEPVLRSGTSCCSLLSSPVQCPPAQAGQAGWRCVWIGTGLVGKCFNALCLASRRIFHRICYISPARFTRANRDYTRPRLAI